jgi:hypothetical protein
VIRWRCHEGEGEGLWLCVVELRLRLELGFAQPGWGACSCGRPSTRA